MRLLKGLLIVLAIAGVTALVLASHSTARPLTAISAVNPAMNFAYVRIEGVVLDYPLLSTADGTLSFQVQDAGGEIRVQAYRATVESLLTQRQIPMPGERVAVEGTLRVRDDATSLTLNTAESLSITSADAKPASLADLGDLMLGDRATVAGQVRSVRDTSTGLRIASLRDGDAQAEVLLPAGLASVFGEQPDLQAGEWLNVTGGVGEYRGQRQLMPAHAADITVLPGRPPQAVAIESLNRSAIGHWVAVRAPLAKLRPVKGGMLLDLQEGAGKAITVVMFENWLGVPFSQTLRSGDTLIAQGEVVDYHGQLELQPELSIDVMRVQ